MQTKYKKRPPSKKSNKPKSTIDPKLLVKKAVKKTSKKYKSTLEYKDFQLEDFLKTNIDKKGYKSPTEIQEKSIPHLLKGKDMIGIAATGTGKTASFLIPIINKTISNRKTQSLVIVPTRELAQQVLEEFKSLTKGLNLFSSCFIGGSNINTDIKFAKRKNNFIVGTPGRLNDLITRKALRLSSTSILVLDEFDRMLDMGFINDVRKISKELYGRNQTMLFSATVDKSQEKLIKEFVYDPIRINVTSGTKSSDHVNQDIIKVEQTENKFDVLLNLINGESFKKVILFAETKRNADRINKKLKNSGILTDVIHGNKSQNYRTRAIKHFKAGKIKVLVATDVAARGIDVDNVTHVINYQLPKTMDSYIHRIGRTGRAGKIGQAYTFIN